MNNQHFYKPQIIYTRLKDVFNEERNTDTEDFSPQNFVKPLTIKKVLDSKENKSKISKDNKKNKDNMINIPEEKKKYINKELVESWIEAIKSSKLIYLFIINFLIIYRF